MPLTEKTLLLDKLHSGMRHGAAGHEFDVHEATIGYIQERGEEICRSALEAAPVRAKMKSTAHDETLETWLNLWTPFDINAGEVMTN